MSATTDCGHTDHLTTEDVRALLNLLKRRVFRDAESVNGAAGVLSDFQEVLGADFDQSLLRFGQTAAFDEVAKKRGPEVAEQMFGPRRGVVVGPRDGGLWHRPEEG